MLLNYARGVLCVEFVLDFEIKVQYKQTTYFGFNIYDNFTYHIPNVFGIIYQKFSRRLCDCKVD